MVKRIYVEKKPALRQEATALLHELQNLLVIDSLHAVRLLNRSDIESFDDGSFQ